MSEKRRNTGLVRAGDSPLFRELLKDLAAPAAPPFSRLKEKILDTAVAVRQEPDEYELAYMALELVQCTLPLSNPGDA